MAQVNGEKKIIADNKKAWFQYHILDRWEAGIVLIGDEVKAVRNKNINFKDSYVLIEKEECFLYDFHISYTRSYGTAYPDQRRKLLLHKSEILRISAKTKEKGLTIVPLSIYFRGQRIKVEIASAKGKAQYDKRKTIKEKELSRNLRKEVW
jgi:SsrA-binding protein